MKNSQFPDLNKNKSAPAAVWINHTGSSRARSLAQRTIDDGYGAYLYYDLTSDNSSTYLSAISTALYNDSTKSEPDCLQKIFR